LIHLGKSENKFGKREKGADQDMDDLVEYVKWITEDLGKLRDRVRIAEKIISDLRRSGEESVESLLSNLYAQKKKQEELDEEADNLRDVINSKEYQIQKKEEEINRVKRFIEMETHEKELQIKKFREDTGEQRKVIENQKKMIHELQILNDFT